MLICDLENYDSIKFLEKQLETISTIQNNFSNIFLIVNDKKNNNNNKKTEAQKNINNKNNKNNLKFLKKICEKKLIKINYINLSEQQNFSQIFEKFINYCLILKKNSSHKIKRNSIKNLQKENPNVNIHHKSEGSPADYDLKVNKRKNKKDCLIF